MVISFSIKREQKENKKNFGKKLSEIIQKFLLRTRTAK